MEDSYRLPQILELIKLHGYRSIILQFPDELIHDSVAVYEYFNQNLQDAEIFILADSSFGSSVDDISAAHVQSEVIVYFGDDLSCTSQTPIIISPYQELLPEYFSMDDILNECSDDNGNILLLFDPKYYCNLLKVLAQCSFFGRILLPRCPPNADLQNWRVNSHFEDSSISLSLGGLWVDKSIFLQPNISVCYVGENHNQIRNISFSIPDQSIFIYYPKLNEKVRVIGQDSKDFFARYGGVSKVKDANVIGLIIGSMGIDSLSCSKIVNRLSSLVEASNKKCVVIVAGKLTESKLGNFPEIDLFCLIGSEMSMIVTPRTFHVPVITPWELELGLDARPWESMYSTDFNLLFSLSNEDALARIKSGQLSMIEDGNDICEEDLAVVVKNQDSSMVLKSNNPLFDRFSTREYRGLLPGNSSMLSENIESGVYGTAKSYVVNS